MKNLQSEYIYIIGTQLYQIKSTYVIINNSRLYTISISRLHKGGFDIVLASIAYNCVMKPLLGLAAGLVRRRSSNTA